MPRKTKVLIVTLRYLGDAFISVSPLVSSLTEAQNDIEVSVLTFKGNEKILEGIPGIHEIITVDRKPGKWAQFKQLMSRLNRYDYAFSVQIGDRPFLYAWFWGKKQFLYFPKKGKTIQKFFTTHPREYDSNILLANFGKDFVKHLGLPWKNAISRPTTGAVENVLNKYGLNGQNFIVLHPFTRVEYKEMTVHQWIDVARFILGSTDYHVVISGAGAHDSEQTCELLSALQNAGENISRVHNLVNRTSIAEMSDLISQAQCFIGMDTGMTHVAASSNTPVIAIYGPTWLKHWGPFSSNGINCYQSCSPRQINGRTIVLQKALPLCQPCNCEGCPEFKDKKTSKCLRELASSPIISELKKIWLLLNTKIKFASNYATYICLCLQICHRQNL